jgi:hypothetical protein
LRVLPYWPKERYLEFAPNHWVATRAKFRSDELDAPLCSFTVPAAQRERRVTLHGRTCAERWAWESAYRLSTHLARRTREATFRAVAPPARARVRSGPGLRRRQLDPGRGPDPPARRCSRRHRARLALAAR